MQIEDFKIQVNPEQSRIVQAVLFENGYTWNSGGTHIQYLNKPMLILNTKYLNGLTQCDSLETFGIDYIQELTFEQFKEKYMNQEEKSLRYNSGKPQWSLVDFKSLEPMVRVLEFGCKKYDRDNWKKGLDKTEILESLSRHLFELMSGEENDPESGLGHIGHIMCNAMFWQYHNNKDK